jgi:tetratricopeptide (TPR) repeat protein
MLHLAPRSLAEDTVWLKSAGESERIYARQGTILDYTGEALTLAPNIRLKAEQVVRVDSAWSAAQQSGDRLLAEGEFSKALAAYQQAFKEEQRRWVKRMILAQMIACYRGEGQLDSAAAAFLALVKDDPATKEFHAIPLVWFSSPRQRTSAAKASEWLRSKEPIERLIGASHLLASPDGGAALETLEALSILPDTPIALLAQAQIWLARLATCKPREPEQWAEAVEKLPEPLRAGPYFVVARAFARHKQPLRAAEFYVRVPILHNKQYHLAAQSLWEAGELFAKLGRSQDAERCYRELVKDYAHAAVAEMAENKLRSAERAPAAE